MDIFPPTIVVRHKKENLKKCSLRGLEKRSDFLFFRYPIEKTLPIHEKTVLLSLEATEELSPVDRDAGLLILDATWRYAKVMEKNISGIKNFIYRRLPGHFSTAYPRCQTGCSVPSQGLASIEAIVCAYKLMGRPIEGLLDHYYWRDHFLEKNRSFL